MEEKCEICGNVAITSCSKCGKLLCEKHIEHGVSLRSNTPTTDCPDCAVKMSRKMRKNSFWMLIIFAIIVIIIIIYFNSIFQFFRV